MNKIRNLVLKNRYTLLVTVLATYVIVLVLEGAITGRDARVLEFENPFFDLNVNNLEEYMNNRREEQL